MMKVRLFCILLLLLYAGYIFTQNNFTKEDIDEVIDITQTSRGEIKGLTGYKGLDEFNREHYKKTHEILKKLNVNFSQQTADTRSDEEKEWANTSAFDMKMKYRPIEDEQNIGDQVQGSSRYDKNIQSMHDIENIEEFRRIERNDEIKNILVNVFVGLAIIAFMIILVFTSRETKK